MARASRRTKANAPAGTRLLAGKDGVQRVSTTGKRWSDEAEAVFLDHLAASCNVTAAAAASGFSATLMFQKRRSDPAFAERWQAALEQGHARLEALLVQRAIEALEGFAPDADTPIPEMTVAHALQILGHHQRRVDGGPRSRRQWARPRSLDEMRDSILAKLEAIEARRRAEAAEAAEAAETPPPSEDAA